MSDGDKPLFFGGMPPRESSGSTPVIDDEHRRSRRIPRWTILSGIGIVAVVAAAALILPQVVSGREDNSFPVAEVTLSPEEQEAITDGGAAVPGHIVSAELCDAIGVVAAVGSGEDPSADTSAELVAALESVAAIESPYQDKYRAYLELTRDPESMTSEKDRQAVASDFTHALQVDVTTCA